VATRPRTIVGGDYEACAMRINSSYVALDLNQLVNKATGEEINRVSMADL
jgi:hypothetical protein